MQKYTTADTSVLNNTILFLKIQFSVAKNMQQVTLLFLTLLCISSSENYLLLGISVRHDVLQIWTSCKSKMYTNQLLSNQLTPPYHIMWLSTSSGQYIYLVSALYFNPMSSLSLVYLEFLEY